MATLVIFNKPFQVLSQFTDRTGRSTLADFVAIPDVYVAGRLDFDSEGLLLLTDSGPLQHQIAHPDRKLSKSYWVQVEGQITDDALKQLQSGVVLKDGRTKPAKARRIPPPSVWDRTPPVRFRKNIPTSWLELTITEGRNRQVRRMTAAVGFPTLRLIRHRIGRWSLGDLQPGQHRVEKVHVASADKSNRCKARPSREKRKRHPSKTSAIGKMSNQGRSKAKGRAWVRHKV